MKDPDCTYESFYRLEYYYGDLSTNSFLAENISGNHATQKFPGSFLIPRVCSNNRNTGPDNSHVPPFISTQTSAFIARFLAHTMGCFSAGTGFAFGETNLPKEQRRYEKLADRADDMRGLINIRELRHIYKSSDNAWSYVRRSIVWSCNIASPVAFQHGSRVST